MTDRIYEFYLVDPTEAAVKTRKTNYTVSSPKGRQLMFKGTVEDFQKVEELYGELWTKVIDNQLGLIDKHAGELTNDWILQNWEGAEIIAIDHLDIEYWYLGNGDLEAIPTDQGETFGVTESAVYYDEDGM